MPTYTEIKLSIRLSASAFNCSRRFDLCFSSSRLSVTLLMRLRLISKTARNVTADRKKNAKKITAVVIIGALYAASALCGASHPDQLHDHSQASEAAHG